MTHLPTIPHAYRKAPLTLAVLAALYGPGAEEALAAPTPAGTEFEVSTNTGHRTPVVAMDAYGNFVVAWQNWSWTNARRDIYARRYNAAGVDQGVGFQVNTNTHTTDEQIVPAVAMDADGDFVVAWESNDGSRISARRYDKLGVAQGDEFHVNTYTTQGGRLATVAMDAAGDFVIAWHRYGAGKDDIIARRYTAYGAPAGGEFQVNTYTTGNQYDPAVAMDADGDFVVTWVSVGQDGDATGIYARRYDKTGGARDASEFQVNTFTTNWQNFPSVAMDADGDFVVAWQSHWQDGAVYGIYAQRYTAAGTRQGSEFLVNTITMGQQQLPAVAMDAAGDFVVTWMSADDWGAGIYARRYNAAGVAQDDPEFQVNTYYSNTQDYPAVAMDAAGDFAVAWESQVTGPYGIYAQRYVLANDNANFNPPVLTGKSTNPTPVTDGPCGVFSFTATFCNKPGGSPLTGLVSQTMILTNNNVLLNRSWGAAGQAPKGVGSGLSFPPTGSYSDYQLTTGECVAVPYQIGLTCPKKSFSFYVDVEGM